MELRILAASNGNSHNREGEMKTVSPLSKIAFLSLLGFWLFGLAKFSRDHREIQIVQNGSKYSHSKKKLTFYITP